MISFEWWDVNENKMIGVSMQRELPRVGERVFCEFGHCKVKRVQYILNQTPKVFIEKELA